MRNLELCRVQKSLRPIELSVENQSVLMTKKPHQSYIWLCCSFWNNDCFAAEILGKYAILIRIYNRNTIEPCLRRVVYIYIPVPQWLKMPRVRLNTNHLDANIPKFQYALCAFYLIKENRYHNDLKIYSKLIYIVMETSQQLVSTWNSASYHYFSVD